MDGRHTNANGQVIPHNHPCCIFLTIFIYFCCRCRESRGSIVGKARTSNGRYKRQRHEQLYIFPFIYTLTTLFVLHLSRPWTVVYTSEVVVDHLRLFFNFQGKKKWQCTKDAPFVLALWWSYIPLSDSFFYLCLRFHSHNQGLELIRTFVQFKSRPLRVILSWEGDASSSTATTV